MILLLSLALLIGEPRPYQDAVKEWNKDRSKPLVVLVTAENCPPCKTIKARIASIDTSRVIYTQVNHGDFGIRTRTTPTILKYRQRPQEPRVTILSYPGLLRIKKLKEIFESKPRDCR